MTSTDNNLENTEEAPATNSETEEPVQETEQLSLHPMRWLIRALVSLAIILAFLLGFVWYAYRSAQVVPDYYQELLEQPIEELAVAGDEFETEILELQNVAIKVGEWQATFSQDQINGWLASDLPEKFPNSLPRNISQPRVSLTNNELKVVFRFESSRFSGIVEASGDAYCTNNLNEVAVRIKRVRSGLLSMPIAPWTERISAIMEKSELPVTWTEDSGDMVALVELPKSVSEEKDQKRIIESIEILEGRLSFHGVTIHPDDLETYQATSEAPAPPSLMNR